MRSIRSVPFIFSKNFWDFCVLLLSLSAITVEANFFNDVMSTASAGYNAVDNAVDKVTNTGEKVVDTVTNTGDDLINNVENAVGSLTDMSVDDKEVIFRYYNKDNPAGEPFNILEFSESKLKGWRKDALLKVITHGWTSSDQSESVFLIKEAYLEKHDFNILTVDWSGPAKHDIYAIPASKTKAIGQIIARLLNELVKKALVTWDTVHIIGHSLGGQVMGVAGAHTEGKVGKLIALDPAGPIFNEIDLPDIRAVDSTDGTFVMVIHTSGGEIGFGPNSSRGHADFYPNGGMHPQPGCSKTKGISCSHGRAYLFLAESIKNPNAFIGKLCDNWVAYKDGQCDNNASEVMGDSTPVTATGNFYLDTNDAPPFGRGG